MSEKTFAEKLSEPFIRAGLVSPEWVQKMAQEEGKRGPDKRKKKLASLPQRPHAPGTSIDKVTIARQESSKDR